MKFVNILRNVAAGLLLLGTSLGFAAETVNLRFVVWDGDEASKVLREELKRFEKAHPNIKVKFEQGVYAQYFDKLLVQYAAGRTPDVAMMNPERFQSYARRGALIPLNDLFKYTPGFDLKTYYKSIVDAHSLGDTLYVLPRDIAPMAVIYYNKKMFREAGLSEPTGDWTWDFEPRPELREKDFTWVVQQLNKKDDRGKSTQWGYVSGWPGLFKDWVYLSLGARLADDYKEPTKVFYDDPRIIKAHQWYSDLTNKQGLLPSSFDQAGTNARQMFTQQRVAMFHSGIWETPQLRTEIKPVDKGGFEWDIVLAPAYKDGTRAYPTGGSGYCVFKNTKHPKEAWILAQWMAGEPGMTAMAKAGIAQPAIKSLALKEPWIPGPNTPADQQVPRNRIITDQAEPYVVFAPSGLLWPEIQRIAEQPFGLVETGDEKASTALPRGNKTAQDRLDTLRKEQNLPTYPWGPALVIGAGIIAAIATWIYLPERKIRRTLKERRENRAGYLFILPWIIGLLAITGGPMIFSLLLSFSDWDIIRDAKWRGLGNYAEAMTIDPTFWKSLSVTLIYTLVSVPLGICMSLGLALLLNTKVKGIPIWRTCYYIPAMASPIAASLIWVKLFQPEGGLINALIFGTNGRGGLPGLSTLFGSLAGSNGNINWLQNEKTALFSLILMSVFGAGGGMVILIAALQSVPQFYYEAATLDGAGPWRKFRNVTIPLISPTLFFVMITGFIGSFQVFTQAWQMTQGGPNNATMFFMLHTYNNAFVTLRMGYASALAWVLFVVILVFTVLQLQGNKFVHYEGTK